MSTYLSVNLTPVYQFISSIPLTIKNDCLMYVCTCVQVVFEWTFFGLSAFIKLILFVKLGRPDSVS